MLRIAVLAGFACVALVASKKDKPVEVFVETIEKVELFDPLTFGGFVEAEDHRAVGAEIEGTISRVFVRLGQSVSRGQRLFSLRPKGAGLDYRLNYVRAPIAGIVSQIAHDPGELVAAGKGVVTVADTTKLEIEIQVTYDDLFQLKQGDAAVISLARQESEDSITTSGSIKSISPAAHPYIGTFPVVVALQCSEVTACVREFRLGTFARVLFKRNRREGISLDAKFLVNQRKQAILLQSDQTVKFVPVKLGGVLGRNVEIIEGLAAGDQVVTNFSRFPREGEKVVVKSMSDEKNKLYSAGQDENKVGKS